MSVIQTTVVGSKFDKSIKFRNKFFLTHILHSGNGIDEMFIKLNFSIKISRIFPKMIV